MAFTPKNWIDSPSTSTPISAAALEDLETRVTDYVDVRASAINVLEYGATGDGSTDDTAAIQDAVDAVEAAGGGTVYFPSGTYLVTTVYLVSDTIYCGSGASTLQQDTGQTDPIFYHPQTANDPILDADLLTNVTIRDLSFIGDPTAGAEAVRCGILIGQGTDIRVEDCRFTDIYSSAVNCAHSLRVWYVNNYVENCGLAGVGVGRNALNIYAGGFSDSTDRTGIIVISGNTVIDTSSAAIVCTSAGGGTDLEFRAIITDNYCENPGSGSGILLESGQGSRASIITGNRIKDFGVGVQTQDNGNEHGSTQLVERNIIANNYITSTVVSSMGVQSQGGRKQSISDNYIRTKGQRITVSLDLQSRRPADLVINGNILENANTVNSDLASALQVWSTDGAVISNNRIINTASNYGEDDITLADVTSVTVIGNSSYLCRRYGIYMENSTDVLVEGNSIINPASFGIITGSSTMTDTDIRSNHISDNRGGSATMSSGIGFSTTTCTRVVVEGNSIHGSTGGPIYQHSKLARGNGNYTDETAAVSSATTIDIPVSHDLATVSGTTTITSITASWAGRQVTLIMSSTAQITDGSNLKLASNFTGAADRTITLVCNGTNWYETGRSAN